MKRIYVLISILFFVFSCVSEKKQFTKLGHSETNIDFVNKLYETNKRNYFTYPYMYLGGGVAAGDFNNDGLEDLFFTGNMVPNKLYLNLGDFKFKDISKSAGIEGDNRWYSGVSLVDINKDGFLDIYIAVGGENEPNNNVLYVNNQDNTFTEIPADLLISLNLKSPKLRYSLLGTILPVKNRSSRPSLLKSPCFPPHLAE